MDEIERIDGELRALHTRMGARQLEHERFGELGRLLARAEQLRDEAGAAAGQRSPRQ